MRSIVKNQYSKRVVYASFLASSFCCVAGANAAAWEFDPRIVVSGVYNDNYLLATVPADKISVSGTQADAGVQIRAESPTWDIVIWPYVTGSYYPGHTDLNEDLEFLDLRLDHLGERVKYAIDGNYSQRTLLDEILPNTGVNYDLGEPPSGTSPGALEQRDRQDLALLRPTMQIALSPRSQLDLRVDYSEATYDHQIPGSYVNYNDEYGSAGWSYELSPRGTLTFSGSASRYSSNAGGDDDTYGLQVQWYKLYTQTTKYYIRVGVNRTEFQGSALSQPTSTSADTISAGAGVSWAFQITTVFLDLTRWVNPSPTGVAVDQNQLRLRFERRWTPRMATFVGVVAVKQDPLGSASETFAASYVSGTVGFEWRYTRAFALVGSYSYALQKLGDQSGSGDANTLKVSVVYQPFRPADSPAISVPY